MDTTHHYEPIKFVTRCGFMVDTFVEVDDNPSPFVMKLIERSRRYKKYGW